MATDADAQAWIDDVVADGGTVRSEVAIDNAIIKLKNEGIWAAQDHIWIRKYTGSEIGALKCLKQLTDSVNFGCAFDDDIGFTGDGVDDFIETNGRNGLTNLVQNSAHYGVKFADGNTLASDSLSGRIGCFIGKGGGAFMQYCINSESIPTDITDEDGFFVATRDGASSPKLYRNGVEIRDDSKTSETPNGGDFASLAYNGNSFSANSNSTEQYIAGTEEVLTIGGALTAAQVSSLNTIINEYYDDVENPPVDEFGIASPEDGATGVTTTPDLTVDNPDVFANLNFQVSESATFDKANVVADIFDTDTSGATETVSVTEALASATQHHLRVRNFTPGGFQFAFLYQEDFTESTAFDDWVSSQMTGTGSFTVTGGEGVITPDPSSQVGIVYDANWTNVDIIHDVEFTNVTTSQQPTIHFRVQGTTWIGNFIPSYYLYFIGNEMRIGRITYSGSPSDYTSENITFNRTANTKYKVRFLLDEYRIRIAIWEASGTQNGWQFDYTDTSQRYASGGFAFKTTSPSAGAESLIVDNIQVSGSEFTEIEQSVDSISISPDSANSAEGTTVGFTGNIQTSGGLSNAGSFTKQSGDSDITIQSTNGSTVIIAISGSASDQDSATFRFTSDEDATKFVDFTVTADVNAQPVSGGEAEDIAILEEISALWDMPNQIGVDNSWKNSGMTLDPAPDGVTVETIGGELRVTSINLKDRGIEQSNGIPDNVENLTEMFEFNVHYNNMSGPLRNGIFKHQKLSRCYLNHVGYTKTDPHIKATGGDGGIQIAGGKDVDRLGGPHNNFTGPMTEFDMPELEWFTLAWCDVGGTIPSGFWNSTKMKFFDIGSNLMDMQSVPSEIGNFTQLMQFIAGRGTNGGEKGPAYFQGAVPSSFTNLVNLDYGGFANQAITSIPDLSSMNPIYLRLAENDLTMPFPDYWVDGTWSRTRAISLTFQNFSGQLPPNIASGFQQFRITSSTGNPSPMTGEVPANLWSNNANSLINVNFSYHDFTKMNAEDLTMLNRIRNLRWYNCQVSEGFPLLDWYNFYNQNEGDSYAGHPCSSFSRFQVQNNKYTSAQINRIITAQPWEIDQNGKSALWYFENKNNLISNVDPNHTIQDYLNDGFSQDCIDSWLTGNYSGSTGYDFMTNMLNDIYDGWARFLIGGQNPD